MSYGLAVIGLAKNAEEVPLDFYMELDRMEEFLKGIYRVTQPPRNSELRDWQGSGTPGPYKWSITEVIDPILDHLAPHVASAAFSRPKLAPTAKSRAVALARIGLSRCTPLREAEPILDQVTYLLAKVAARDLDLDLYRSRIGSFQGWVASGDFEEISSFVDGTKSAGPGFSLGIKKRQGSHVGAELVRTAETTGMLQKLGQLVNIGDRSKPKILRNSYPIFSTGC